YLRITTASERTGVLYRGKRLLTESTRGMKGKIGVAEKLARQQDDIGLALGQNGIGLLRCSDESHGGGCDIRISANGGREWNLISGRVRNLLQRAVAAAGTIDKINSEAFQAARQFDGVFQGPAPLHPIGSRDTKEQR